MSVVDHYSRLPNCVCVYVCACACAYACVFICGVLFPVLLCLTLFFWLVSLYFSCRFLVVLDSEGSLEFSPARARVYDVIC